MSITPATAEQAQAIPTEAEQRDKYIAELKAHDWSYEYSDDHTVWQRGHNAHSRLTRTQREIDPDFRIWNEHAPTLYRVVRADLERAANRRADSRGVQR